MNFVIDHSYLIPLLPLVGAVLAGFFGARWLKGQSHWPIWIGVGISAVLAIVLLVGMAGHAGHQDDPSAGHAGAAHAIEPTDAEHAVDEDAPVISSAQRGLARAAENSFGISKTFFTWIEAGSFRADAGFWFDPLTAVMLAVVCGIGFLITIFAAGYMKGEEGYFRFFAYLGLFIFMMTILVMGENLIMLYLGWEGVGLCSYLLIGYYYDKPAAREAAKKAFLVNRIGDLGFGLGIMLSFLAFGTVSYYGGTVGGGDGLLERAAEAMAALHGNNYDAADTVPAIQRLALDWVPFLLMLGAFGKSAQFPLYVWLPDAMEGPTPVSALIHAATMVTAGVYMIARCGTLFFGNDAALVTIAVVGAFTALFAGTIALRQFDLKKVFAYSTVSQLGFMFVGVAVLAPVAGVFHLVTHAFFKALLFLSSGVVMHAMHGVLDMRQMSGLKRVLPKTNILMLVGCLALAGVPGLSGFFSKDEIVHAAGFHRMLLTGVLLLTAFLTAYYTFRLYFRVFQGPLVVPARPAEGHGHGHVDPAGGHVAHGHETPIQHAHVHTEGEPQHTPAAHAVASASAVDTGTAHESGKDEHLDTAAHQHATSDDHGHHNHEPWVMILPLALLAIGAIFVGYINFPRAMLGDFLGQSPSFAMGYEVAKMRYHAVVAHGFGVHDRLSPEATEALPVMLVSGWIALMGIGAAYLLHLRDRARADRLAAGARPLTALLEAKYWVDEIYDAIIVQPLRWVGKAFFFIDRWVIDGLVSLAGLAPWTTGQALRLGVQRGYLQGYAAAMLFGIAAILLLIFL